MFPAALVRGVPEGDPWDEEIKCDYLGGVWTF
jgi:hypothetical protein